MGRYALTPQTVTWPQVAPRFFCFGPVFLSPAALLARLCAAMGKKGKRASSDGSSVGADTSRRRSAGPTAEETLRKTRVAGPAVLPPPTADRKSNKRVELDLVSKRIYQETILRCVRSSIVVEAKQRRTDSNLETPHLSSPHGGLVCEFAASIPTLLLPLHAHCRRVQVQVVYAQGRADLRDSARRRSVKRVRPSRECVLCWWMKGCLPPKVLRSRAQPRSVQRRVSLSAETSLQRHCLQEITAALLKTVSASTQ